MLNIDCGENVDAVVQQFLDILPALRMPAARRVGVRELIHEDPLRT